jgi:undecaprenyl-diphosphatase
MPISPPPAKTITPMLVRGRLSRGPIVGALISGAVGFGVIAHGVGIGVFREFDEAVLRAFRSENLSVLAGPHWAIAVARFFTWMGDAGRIVAAGLLVLGVLASRRAWQKMIWVTFTIAVGYTVSAMLKGYYERPRPAIVPHLVEVSSTSFPSQHAFVSVVTALTFAVLLLETLRERRQKMAAVVVALAIAAMVGTSRVVLGVHYPSDVLAGWCGGIAWFSLCGLAYFARIPTPRLRKAITLKNSPQPEQGRDRLR